MNQIHVGGYIGEYYIDYNTRVDSCTCIYMISSIVKHALDPCKAHVYIFVSIQHIWLEALSTSVSSSRCYGNIVRHAALYMHKEILWNILTCEERRVWGQVHFLLPQKIHLLHISGTEIIVRAMGCMCGGRSVLHCLLYHPQQATSW